MTAMNKNRQYLSEAKSNNGMSGEPIRNDLESDNAFSDNGLENARLLNKALKNGNSK